MAKTEYRLAPGCNPQWDIPKIYDILVELYNREHGTDYEIICTKKEKNDARKEN